MPLKQQTLSASLDCRTTRRITRIGSHNCNWDAVMSEDIMELLVDAIMDGDKYWMTLRNMRSVSKAFYHVVNARLDVILAELKTKADAARRELELMPRLPRPDPRKRVDRIKLVHEVRAEDPVTYSAYHEYRGLLGLYFRDAIVMRILMCNKTTGFWIHRDELFAWRLEACIKCRGRPPTLDHWGDFKSSIWMPPCHSRDITQTCFPVSLVTKLRKSKMDKRAAAILSSRPRAKALTALLEKPQYYSFFWVLPIPGIPPEYTLLGASGMNLEDVDRRVAEAEAEAAVAAEARLAKRTARRDAELVKLEAAAGKYLKANVPSIPTLSRLQDLEEFYGFEHAIARRPFPPHHKLPLRRVRFDDRMKIFHEHVAKLA
jgi:hypothetical protein